jgi:hypothetical protein
MTESVGPQVDVAYEDAGRYSDEQRHTDTKHDAADDPSPADGRVGSGQ